MSAPPPFVAARNLILSSTRTGVRTLVLGTCLSLLTAGCSDDDGPGEGQPVPVEQCASGLIWANGDEESPLMHPGGDCIGCHTAEDEGPTFAIAGTVYEGLAAAIDCFGVSGVTVELTDDAGQVVRMTTNEAGNFFLKSRDVTLQMPYTAKVIVNGVESVMATPQSDANCATCHSAEGANGAPGRIIVGQ